MTEKKDILTFDAIVDSAGDLPHSGAKHGDIYFVRKEGVAYMLLSGVRHREIMDDYKEENPPPSPDVFVRGEEVEVRDDVGRTKPEKAKYFGTAEGEDFPYIAKTTDDTHYIGRNHIRKLPQQEVGPKKVTKEEAESFLGWLHNLVEEYGY